MAASRPRRSLYFARAGDEVARTGEKKAFVEGRRPSTPLAWRATAYVLFMYVYKDSTSSLGLHCDCERA